MARVKITVKQAGGITGFTAEEGANLLSELRKHKYPIIAYCSGLGRCGKCRVKVNGIELLACRISVKEDAIVELTDYGEVSVNHEITENYVINGAPSLALDIGTTTLALAVLDVENGDVAKVYTADNPQKNYGADVLSRIDYCVKGGEKTLNKLIVSAVNSLISRAKADYELDNCAKMTVVGNTTMLHIFFNRDCSAMGVYPYTPDFLDAQSALGKDLGLNFTGKVESIKCASAFIGADAVAAVLAVGAPEKGCKLMVDLGTNAEIALIKKDKIFFASAAAGPCFEGAGISSGMNATAGAICAAEFKEGKCTFVTIEDEKPKGICGTGLIDLIGEMVKAGIIDENGTLSSEKIEITTDIALTQQDVREYQLAKAAIKSGIEALMRESGVNVSDVEEVCLAGGFAAYVNTANAVVSGLLPAALTTKCRSIGNAALSGAVMAASDKEVIEKLPEMRVIDLNHLNYFNDMFITNLMF